MKNELQLVKNFTYAGSNDRQTYNYICLYIVYGVRVIDVVLSSLNGIDWRSIDRCTIVCQRSKSMVHQNLMTIDYGITSRVDSSTVIIDIISFSTLCIVSRLSGLGV